MKKGKYNVTTSACSERGVREMRVLVDKTLDFFKTT